MAELMKGKRGLVMGVANKNSIAWGIAQQLAAQGAELAFSYQDEALERRVRPLVESLQRQGVRVSVVSTIRSQPPMIADELRRQADNFIELDELRDVIGRPPREPRDDAEE